MCRQHFQESHSSGRERVGDGRRGGDGVSSQIVKEGQKTSLICSKVCDVQQINLLDCRNAIWASQWQKPFSFWSLTGAGGGGGPQTLLKGSSPKLNQGTPLGWNWMCKQQPSRRETKLIYVWEKILVAALLWSESTFVGDFQGFSLTLCGSQLLLCSFLSVHTPAFTWPQLMTE